MRELHYDKGPYGTPTIYLSAAMIIYNKTYRDKMPASMALPIIVRPLVKTNYARTASIVGDEVECP